MVHKRYLDGSGRHVAFIGDAAFATNDVRTVVADRALHTGGAAVDLTLSVNYSWNTALWDLLSKDLPVDCYRTYYSPMDESTTVLFKCEKDSTQHTIIRWSNAYEDPRTAAPDIVSAPAPAC